VGHRYLDDYFRQCGRLVRSTGSFVLQAIVMPERVHGNYLKCVDFIQRYVFPGGCLPSVGSILASVGRTTDFRLAHIEDMAPHYSRTLKLWRETFEQRLDVVREQGYSERFIRLWRYYLAYCEAVFAERHVGVVQIRLDKPKCRRDPLDFESRVSAGTAARLVPLGEQF
jgi:cyclopropane-fatty-acyl-phospholipid synthase